MGSRVRKVDVIDMESYESGYHAGYSDGASDAYRKRGRKKKRRLNPGARERLFYFLKQKLAGTALLLLTDFGLRYGAFDFTVACFTVPLGLVLFFSRRRLLDI